jgi:CBS domain containing-hemolysin-like protein
VNPVLGIAVTVLLLALNAFFVAAEFALVSARRSAIEGLAEGGSRRAVKTLRAMENLSLMMAGAQLGITVCSLAIGSLSEPVIAHLLESPFDSLGVTEDLVHPVAFVIALLLVTFLHVVLGEMVPKNITLAGPDAAALWLGPPLAALVRVLRPVTVGFNALANAVLRLFHIEPREEVSSTYDHEQVAGLVDESHREGLVDEDEHELLTNALSLDELQASSLLLPLSQLSTVPADASPADVERLTARTGFSRYPVTAGGDADTGELVGYLHLKDVLAGRPGEDGADDAERPERLRPEWVRPLPQVRLDDPLRTVLAVMQRRGAHLARVVDAAGTTVGLVALEDVLEELVGRIRDDASAGRRR